MTGVKIVHFGNQGGNFRVKITLLDIGVEITPFKISFGVG